MMPFLFSLIGISVTFICLFFLYKAGTALYRRRLGEALVKDVQDILGKKNAQSSDSKDSIG